MPLLLSFLRNVYVPAKLLGRSLASLEQYELAVKHFNAYMLASSCREASVLDFSDSVMESFACWLIQAKGMAVPTVNKTRRHLKAIWNLACKRNVSNFTPTFTKLKELSKDPAAWTPEEIGRLLAVIERLSGTVGGVPARLFWRGLVLFLYDTGARINVTMNMEPRHFDLKARTALLPAEFQKTGEDHLVDLSEETCAVLRQLIDRRRSYVFCWEYDRYANSKWTALHRYFRAIVLGAELDPNEGTFHRLRRTAATLVADQFGMVSAQELLGHAHPGTTKRYVSKQKLSARRRKFSDSLPRPWITH